MMLIQHRAAVRLLVLLVWIVFVLVLISQTSDFPLVRLMSLTIASTEFGAAIGHAGICAVLTATLYTALLLRFQARYALLSAMVVALIFGTVSEIFQSGVITRSSSISDLMANWLGVFVVGFMISFVLFNRATQV